MRAAAVQLQSTPDRERNLATADRLTRGRPPAGAELVVLPGEVAGARHARADDRRRRAVRRPDPARGRRASRASSASTSSPARSPSASTAASAAPTRRSTSAPTASCRRPTARSTCSTSRSAGASTRSPSTRRRATRSCVSETADGVGLGPDASVTTSASPSSTGSSPSGARRSSPCRPRSRSPRRATTGRSCCAPARSRARRSSSPPTRSASTRPGIRSGGRSMIVDPWGVVLATAPDTETFVDRRARPRAPGRDPPHAALAGQPPSRGVPLADRGHRVVALQAGAVDKRRIILDAAVRVFAREGFHTCRVSDIADEAGVAYGLVYHYFKSKDQVLDTLFLERWDVLLEAIRETDAPGRPRRAEAARDRRLHHRLLPSRSRPDEGDHRRGHARRELVRRGPHRQDRRGLRADPRRGREGAADGRVPRRDPGRVRGHGVLRRDRAGAHRLDLRAARRGRRRVRAGQGPRRRDDLSAASPHRLRRHDRQRSRQAPGLVRPARRHRAPWPRS